MEDGAPGPQAYRLGNNTQDDIWMFGDGIADLRDGELWRTHEGIFCMSITRLR